VSLKVERIYSKRRGRGEERKGEELRLQENKSESKMR